MNIIAIDPGLTGGISSITTEPYSLQHSLPMPIRKIEIKKKIMIQDLLDGKKQYVKSGINKGKVKMKMKSKAKYKTELDTVYLLSIFKKADIIVIEQQNPRPGNSAASSASTMKNYGKLLALAEVSEAELVLVAPMTWKKHYGLNLKPAEKKLLTPTEYKKLSIDKAHKLSGFRTSSDGIADSICIGYWYIEAKLQED